MISVRHLTKKYPQVTPLSDVSVDIEKGEVISIIGPSGTGKSTLLRCLNLLELPTEGEIIVDGVTITDPKCKLNLVRQKMGMVFQSFNLFNHMNVIENITYGPMKLLKIPKDEAYARARDLLKTVGLADKELNYPDELSGGQKQRVAIARTLAMGPDIILFDEPTSALDPTMVGEVLGVIKNLAREGMTMVIVTHEMKFARDVSTRIFYMDQGKIYEDGPPEQIFDNPQKELTRKFVRQLRTFEKDIQPGSFDFFGVLSELEQFGNKYQFSYKTMYRIHSILEELCLLTILPKFQDDDTLNFKLEYSAKDHSINIDIQNKNITEKILKEMDHISKKMLENTADDISCYDSCIHIILKEDNE